MAVMLGSADLYFIGLAGMFVVSAIVIILFFRVGTVPFLGDGL